MKVCLSSQQSLRLIVSVCNNLLSSYSVDTYVAENPVPDEYANRILIGNNNFVSEGGRVHKITAESFKRKSYSAKWNGSKSRRSRRGK